jgi:hypothetical protein
LLLLWLLAHTAGHATGGRTNDLLLLELSGWTWTQPSTSGTAPSPRSCAAITVGNGHHLIIHGGRNNFVLDDMHVLDLLTRTWIDVSCAHTCLQVFLRGCWQQLAREMQGLWLCWQQSCMAYVQPSVYLIIASTLPAL